MRTYIFNSDLLRFLVKNERLENIKRINIGDIVIKNYNTTSLELYIYVH